MSSEQEGLFNMIKNIRVCRQCGNEFQERNDSNKHYCSHKCEFMYKVSLELYDLEAKLEQNIMVCDVCGSEYNIRLDKKTNYPYCSRKCKNIANEKDSKRKLNKDISYLAKIHNGVITNKQVTDKLKERILVHYPSVKKAVESRGYKYQNIRSSKTSRVSKHYKRTDIKSTKVAIRSAWEANIIRLLDKWKIPYIYEPEMFTFPVRRGIRAYVPDILIRDTNEYWEIKGYMDRPSATKISRFRQYFPEYDLVVIDKDDYKDIKNIGVFIKNWEWDTVDEIKKSEIIRKVIT